MMVCIILVDIYLAKWIKDYMFNKISGDNLFYVPIDCKIINFPLFKFFVALLITLTYCFKEWPQYIRVHAFKH